MNNKRQKRPAAKKGVLGRVLKSLFRAYPKMTTFALFCITVNAVISSLPSIFMERVFTVVGTAIGNGGWAAYGGEIVRYMLILIGLYAVSLVLGAIDKQMMAVITQGYLKKLRLTMFNGMQDLPIKYLDRKSVV